MTPAFKTALEVVLHHEGGYVDNPKDPGGETKHGISKRAYPDLDIPNLTKAQAAEIYFKDYWQKIRGDRLPFGVSLILFDFAVNAGIKQAVKCLQKVVSVKRDGVFGDMTMIATFAHNKAYVMECLTTERILYYSKLNNFETFGAGWIRRSIETLSTALLSREMING